MSYPSSPSSSCSQQDSHAVVPHTEPDEMSTENSLRETLKILAGSPMLQGGDVETVLDTLRSAGNIEEKAAALQCTRNRSHTNSGCLRLRLALERTLALISSRRAERISRIAGPSRVVGVTNSGCGTMARMSCESFLNAASGLESDVLLQGGSANHHDHESGMLGTAIGWRPQRRPSLSEHRSSRLRSDGGRLRDRADRALFLPRPPSGLALEPIVHGVQQDLQEGLTAGSNQELLPLLYNSAAMSIASGVDDLSLYLRRARLLCTTTATAGMQPTSSLLPPSQQRPKTTATSTTRRPSAALQRDVLQYAHTAPSTAASLVDLFLRGDGW